MLAHQIEGFRQELNFRDLGGYRTGDGREIRRGLLLRGAAPGDMTEEEQERLCHMGSGPLWISGVRENVRRIPIRPFRILPMSICVP